MSIWRLVSGILSMLLSFFVMFQSCIAGVGNIISDNGEMTGTAGLFTAIMMLTTGIISTAGFHSRSTGVPIALMILNGVGGGIGYMASASYADMKIWAIWCFTCAAVAFISLFTSTGSTDEE